MCGSSCSGFGNRLVMALAVVVASVESTFVSLE